jgi:hypothetical protein
VSREQEVNRHDRIDKEANSEIENTKTTEGKSEGSKRKEGNGYQEDRHA